ncbi:hypothetical protein SLA2020_455800 [Shorea laevis]
MERQYAPNDGNILQYSRRRETTTIIGIGDVNATEGTASKISTELVEPNGPVLVQSHVRAEPIQTNQTLESDSIFLLSTVQANDTPRTCTWKWEARDRKLKATTSRSVTLGIKRKDEPVLEEANVDASGEKRGRGVQDDGT